MWMLRRMVMGLVLILGLVLAYGGWGFVQARDAAPALAARADRLISEGRGPDGLGQGRAAELIAVVDPAFASHSGIDPTTPGAGSTTITQAVASRFAFAPGIQRIRQTGYAFGLERELSKVQILALYLDTVPMGPGPGDIGAVHGFFAAAAAHYDMPVAGLAQSDFIRLLAVMIAPDAFSLARGGPALDDRAVRIAALLDGKCAPATHGDIWLTDCAGKF